MAKSTKFLPRVFNLYKPPGMTSYDVVRHMKYNLPKGYGKIGHFGTLDPFAEGVLMIGIAGATRINNYVHDLMPKTYLAKGKLGVETETGDMTVEPSQVDDSDYLNHKISRFDVPFLQEQLAPKFTGVYMQAPHKYSAAKFEGKALHQWAREGIDIKKDKVERFVYEVEVVEFDFPYLTVRATVSSGTYIRTLFSDMANYIGTLGALETLVREKVGGVSSESAMSQSQWPKRDTDFDIYENSLPLDQVLTLSKVKFCEEVSVRYRNGIPAKLDAADSVENVNSRFDIDSSMFYWVYDNDDVLIGLGECADGIIRPAFNLPVLSNPE